MIHQYLHLSLLLALPAFVYSSDQEKKDFINIRVTELSPEGDGAGKTLEICKVVLQNTQKTSCGDVEAALTERYQAPVKLLITCKEYKSNPIMNFSPLNQCADNYGLDAMLYPQKH